MTHRLAIFRQSILPISETFIRSQAQSLTRWRPILIGFKRATNSLDLKNIPACVVGPNSLAETIHESMAYWAKLPVRRLTRLLTRIGADMVHAHFGPDAVHIWPSVRAAGLPMLVTLHGYDVNIRREWWKSGKGGSRNRVYPERLLQLAQEPKVGFLAVSEAIRQRAIESGIPQERITTSYIGVDLPSIPYPGPPLSHRRKRILFVGRMVEKKAPDLLLDSFLDVLKQVPDAELTFIGDGPLLPKILAVTREKQLPVQVLGSRPWEEVIQQLGLCRVFCLPSITAQNGDAEGLPIALLEAMASGVAVVSSDSSGIKEAVLHKKTGLLFHEHDRNQLSSHLVTLMRDSALCERLAVEARRYAALNFNLGRCTKSLEDILDQHLALHS